VLCPSLSPPGNLTLTLTSTRTGTLWTPSTCSRGLESTFSYLRNTALALSTSPKNWLNLALFWMRNWLGFASMVAMTLHTSSKLWWMSTYPTLGNYLTSWSGTTSQDCLTSRASFTSTAMMEDYPELLITLTSVEWVLPIRLVLIVSSLSRSSLNFSSKVARAKSLWQS